MSASVKQAYRHRDQRSSDSSANAPQMLLDFGANSEQTFYPSEGTQRSYLFEAAQELGFGALLEPESSGFELRLLDALTRRVDFTTLDALIGGATVADRQAAYRQDQVHRAIAASHLSHSEQLAVSTALAEGSLTWGHPCGSSEFSRFFGEQNGQGPPPEMNRMNCYELILYSAWKLGLVTTAQIVLLHDQGDQLGQIRYADLGYSPDLPKVGPGSAPTPGQIVFVTLPGETKPWHVVLSMGGDEAMSLWRDTPGATRVKLSDYISKKGATVSYCDLPRW